MSLPGQRSAQPPMRAAVSVQRSIGRAVASGGTSSSSLVLNLGGRWMRQVTDDEGQERLVPHEIDGEE